MDWVEGNLVRLHSAQVGLSGRGHPFVDIEIGVALNYKKFILQHNF